MRFILAMSSKWLFPIPIINVQSPFVAASPALKNPQQRYWGSNLPRLERIKQEVDPMELFWNPQSIRPLSLGRVPPPPGQCIELNKPSMPVYMSNQQAFTIENVDTIENVN